MTTARPIAFSSCAFLLLVAAEGIADDWFHTDDLARGLCQITEQEYGLLQSTDLIDLRPVVLPRPEYVVSGNDYFDWPIATQIDDTILVLFDRRHYHWGGNSKKEPRADENSGIRMITTSLDGGRTWSAPLDVLAQAGRWPRSLFGGWGGGLGVHDGVVYLAVNEGVYCSADKGRTWALVVPEPDVSRMPEEVRPVKDLAASESNYSDKNRSGAIQTIAPFWSPGMRITFDAAHGLTVWTTRGFKPVGRDGKTNSDYGKYLCALYSPDFGTTWHLEEQKLPDGLYINEITPLQFDGRMAFFFRNGIRGACYGQGYSATGWFPFQFAVTEVGPVDITDTPDLIFNPTTGRLEAAATFRHHTPGKPMELRLYSIAPDALAAGSSDWRFDGVLVRYRERFGTCDGMNPVGGIVDEKTGTHRIYIWAGDAKNQAGIFECRRTLETGKLGEYLEAARGAGE